MKKAAWSVLSQQASSHVQSRIHSRLDASVCIGDQMWDDGS